MSAFAPCRPTLYDLLAYRALRVFSNGETRLTEPSWRFSSTTRARFALFEDFAIGRSLTATAGHGIPGAAAVPANGTAPPER
jgi:hypothetical protein